MSVKHYCDGCGEQIDRNYVASRLKPELQIGGNRISLEIIVSINGTSNAGDLCAYCLRKVFNEGRDTSGKGGSWPLTEGCSVCENDHPSGACLPVGQGA